MTNAYSTYQQLTYATDTAHIQISREFGLFEPQDQNQGPRDEEDSS